jgi:hypothetical protein
MAADPRTPLRADHRFLREIVSSSLGGKVESMPEDFDRISRVFHRLGGSWERIFKGSPADIALLKKTVKVAYKGGMLTKSPDWGA